jgi:endonuclease III
MAADVPIRTICAILDDAYGSPSLGNKDDPLDELAFIILSTRTNERVYQPTYNLLKQHFPSWEDVTPERQEELVSILAPAGFGRLKAGQIVGIIGRLKHDFGAATLEPLRTATDEEAEGYLTSLPGVAKKVAKCVLMYSLKRQVLPVDSHVHRVATRLGFLTKKRPDTSQDLIEAAVPPDLRYGFHVNCIAHGRAICVPVVPRCGVCPVRQHCAYFQEGIGGEGKL